LKSRQTTPAMSPGFDCGSTACFAPAGTWSVQLAVLFSNGRGSAAYYWQVTVH